MKNKMQILSFVLIVILYMTGCEKAKVGLTAENLPAVVSFSKNIVPILNSNCISCHGSSGGSAMTAPVLSGENVFQNLIESADTINPESSDLYLMVTAKASNPMPPSSELSDYDAGMILKWMKQGAKNN
jgi:uncharacterized membrane protein